MHCYETCKLLVPYVDPHFVRPRLKGQQDGLVAIAGQVLDRLTASPRFPSLWRQFPGQVQRAIIKKMPFSTLPKYYGPLDPA